MTPSGKGKRGPDKAPRVKKPRRPASEAIQAWREKRNARLAPSRDPFDPDSYEAPPFVPDRSMHSDQIMESVRANVGGILKLYFGFEWMPFHLEAIDDMFVGGKRVLNWPTDHAKSYMTSYFFPILSLMADPNGSHIICGSNAADSKRRVEMIARELETNHTLTRDYPWLKKPGSDVQQKWNSIDLTIAGRSSNRPDPSVHATSTTANDIKGRRGKLIIDDAEGEDHRNSALKRQRLFEWIDLAAQRTYEDVHESDRPLTLACGTPMDVDSVYFRLTKAGWKTSRRPVYTDPEPWAHVNPRNHMNTMLWPAKYDKIVEQYDALRTLNPAAFAVNYLMDPKAGNPNRLSIEEIERLTTTAVAPGHQPVKYVSLDPASGSSSRNADYAGVSVVSISWPAKEQLPTVQVLECHKVPYPAGYIEHVNLVADLALEYDCRIIYESNAQQGGVYRRAFSHHRPEVMGRLIGFHTGGHGQSTNKFDEEMGLTVVQRLVRESRLLVPQSLLESEGVQALLREVRDLGSTRKGAHDHISASIWFVVRYVFNQIRTAKGPKVISTWGGPPPLRQNPYIDRDPEPAAAQSGWSFQPYRRFGR